MLNHRIVAVLVLLGLLAACGQKGPLYLPEEDTDQSALGD